MAGQGGRQRRAGGQATLTGPPAQPSAPGAGRRAHASRGPTATDQRRALRVAAWSISHQALAQATPKTQPATTSVA